MANELGKVIDLLKIKFSLFTISFINRDILIFNVKIHFENIRKCMYSPKLVLHN